MHIVFASVEFVTEKMHDGGLANYLAKAAGIFANHGHKVTVVVLSQGNDTFEYEKKIQVIRVQKNHSEITPILKLIKNIELKENLEWCWYGYQLNKRIKELNKQDKIDIVQYCHLKALGLFRLKEIPCVVRMSSFNPIKREAYRSDFEFGKFRAMVDFSDKLDFLALRRADGVFAPSALTAAILKKVVRKEIKILESPAMGVDISQMQSMPEILSGRKYFLFFGTLSNIKGLKVIIQAVYDILKNNPAYAFVFVGKDCGVSMQDGMRTPVVRKLREQAGEYADRIIYFPSIADRRLLNSIIYHAQLCILPFRFENLPNTCVEAMELGRIVISTYQSGVSQLIKNGYNGFLIEQNNPAALVEKIQEVLVLPEDEKKKLSENAVRRVKRMSPENFYKYMMDYYQEIMDFKKSGGRKKDNYGTDIGF